MFLGIIVIFPWVIVLVYDVILYIFRSATYDIPYVGGRARNRPRPRAPSFSERPSGRARTFSLSVPGITSSLDEAGENVEGLKKRSESLGHERSGSNVMIDDGR